MSETDLLIINAAKELFSQKGYTAVRTKEISSLAGINEATLFRHFKSKRELFERTIIQNIKAFDGKKLFHEKVVGDLAEDLHMITSQFYMVYEANAKIIKMIMKSIIEDNDSLTDYSSECRGGHMKKYLLRYFEEMQRKHIIDDDPELLTDLYMNCINGYLFSAFILGDREADLEQLQQITKKILKSINVCNVDS